MSNKDFNNKPLEVVYRFVLFVSCGINFEPQTFQINIQEACRTGTDYVSSKVNFVGHVSLACYILFMQNYPLHGWKRCWPSWNYFRRRSLAKRSAFEKSPIHQNPNNRWSLLAPYVRLSITELSIFLQHLLMRQQQQLRSQAIIFCSHNGCSASKGILMFCLLAYFVFVYLCCSVSNGVIMMGIP